MADWDPYEFQVPQDGEGPVGRAILVMLLVLVGLLEVMAAGSKVLMGTYREGSEGWVLTSVLLTLIGLSYFALARGVWALRSWVPMLAVLLTLLVLAFGILRFSQDAVLDLALALTFLLAMVTNLGLLGWAHLPATRALLQDSSAGSKRDAV